LGIATQSSGRYEASVVPTVRDNHEILVPYVRCGNSHGDDPGSEGFGTDPTKSVHPCSNYP
jgi:hypothetical protein